MLPIASDNGARLAGIMPSALAALLRGSSAPQPAFDVLFPGLTAMERERLLALLPAVRSVIVIVVDGMGTANLKARAGHAPVLMSLPQRRISTVIPSTTSAALTTLTTGELPGAHGLVGYRIRHPELGLLTPLREWEGISDPRSWQRADTLFERAAAWGVESVSVGRPAHAESGLSSAILTGSRGLTGERIADRFRAARAAVESGEPTLVYLYIDELDRAGHREGWESSLWTRRLEQLDVSLGDLLAGLPSDVGVVITADHGMVDLGPDQRVHWSAEAPFLADVEEIGGEPRFRSLYLSPGSDVERTRDLAIGAEGDRAWVGTREEAIQAGWFGPVAPEVADRLGDVLIAARRRVAFYEPDADPAALAMIGQHGSLSDEERGVPLIMGGAFAGSALARVIAGRAG